jgi:hypothetical protein
MQPGHLDSPFKQSGMIVLNVAAMSVCPLWQP